MPIRGRKTNSVIRTLTLRRTIDPKANNPSQQFRTPRQIVFDLVRVIAE